MEKSEKNNIAPIYVFCALCGFLAVFIFRRNLGAEYAMMQNMGFFKDLASIKPVLPADWVALFRTNTLVALVLSDFFDVINSILVSLLTLGLFLKIQERAKKLSKASIILSFLGTIFYIAAYLAFLSTTFRTGEFVSLIPLLRSFALLFLFTSGIIASLAMKISGLFSKAATNLGLFANISGLFYFVFLIFYQQLIFLPLTISAPFIIVWYYIIARRILKTEFSV